jgi:hypothetical protein
MTLTLADWTPDIAARAAALDPLVLRVPLPAATVLLTAYATISPFFPDVRARAYILSVVSSATMTLASLPFVARYLSGGLPAVWAAGQDGWTRTLSTVLIPAFATYLFSECCWENM